MRASRYFTSNKTLKIDPTKNIFKLNFEWVSAHVLIIIGIIIVISAIINCIMLIYGLSYINNSTDITEFIEQIKFFCFGLVLIIIGKIFVKVIEAAENILEILSILKIYIFKKDSEFNSEK